MIKKLGMVILALGLATVWIGISQAAVSEQQVPESQKSESSKQPAATTGTQSPQTQPGQAGQQPGAPQGTEKPKPQVKEKPVNLTSDKVTWSPCGPEIPGCEIAVIHGDPTKGPSDVYIRFPAGGTFPKHWHTNNERLVGIQGTVTINLEDGTVATISPGAFVFLPGGMVHWGGCTNEGPCLFYLYNDMPTDTHLVKEGATVGGQTGATTTGGGAATGSQQR